ncbi:BLUF domain-containing protein [Thalassotalea euphylliae]|uniref:BLUF domain-containing protein n=1 Tax=Thalassotalea euphylliae TaxID=1655234 RepID=UPI0036380E07
MFLTRIIYASKATDAFKPEDIDDILTTARDYNQKQEITGMLCFSRKFFLQCLEGSRSSVNKLYHQILNDKRHNDIVLLEYSEITEREFSQWSMAYVPESSLTAPLNLKFSGSSIFDPYQMRGESAHKMMLELKEVLTNVT